MRGNVMKKKMVMTEGNIVKILIIFILPINVVNVVTIFQFDTE